MSPRPGNENRVAAHRHALHALEDFRALATRMGHSRDLMEIYGKYLHTISHHLRHTVYRLGKEVDSQVRVERSA
jgi:hypothetical protein